MIWDMFHSKSQKRTSNQEKKIAGTRAAAQPQPELQDLGDGVMAEVSLVPDTTHRVQNKAATRAILYTYSLYYTGLSRQC